MASLEILHPGLLMTIQDLGRKGLAYYAIPNSGVMDRESAALALEILKLPEEHPLLECTSKAPKIRFQEATQLVLTGADFNWKINGQTVGRNTIHKVKKSDILEGSFARDGMRGYLGINGDLKISKVYGSYATYTNAKLGGFQGRALQKGDVIEWENRKPVGISDLGVIHAIKDPVIPIYPGPEFSYLNTRAIQDLEECFFKISPDSNRMGARLIGPSLESRTYQLKYSAPVLPGFIQLPPSGLPIVLLQDGQISGGYPRIAYIPEENLASFNQLPFGKPFQFEWVKGGTKK